MSVRARDSIALLSTVEVYSMLAAQEIRVGHLEATSITTENLTAKLIEADYITATEIASQYVTTNTLTANYITAQDISTTYLTAANANLLYATVGDLTAATGRISDLEANAIRTDTLNAAVANLGYVTATQVAAGYADIGLANVELISGEAFIIQDSITNNALINAAYIKDLTADSLRLRGKDGLYYAINVDQGEVTTAQADADLNTYGSYVTGKSILDQTIVANKLYVDDLSAIHGTLATAMIGGLTLENTSIHSANVTSVNDTDTGFYLNSAGELALIGTSGALKFFIDTSDNNKRKLSIIADSIFIGSNNVGTAVSHAETAYSNGIKNTIQLWYTKANTTAPNKPSSVVTSTSTDGNGWRTVVPTYNASYPYYYYCFQHQYNNGSYGWTDVVRDRATEESQSQARTAAGDLASYITSNNTAITNLQSQLDGQIEAWYIDGAPNTTAEPNQNDPALQWTTLDLKKRHLGDLYYDINTGHSWRYLATDQEDASSYTWSQIPDSDAAAALAAAQNAQSLADSKRRIFVSTPTVPYNIGDVWIDTVNGAKVIKYATVNKSTGSYSASDWTLAATAVTEIVREYATNQSATTAPTTGWDTRVPTWQDGWYIWERVTTYTNGTSSVGTPVCISGATGATGDPGNGIASITAYYATTTVQVAPSASSITSTTIPEMSATNKYLWKKEVVTYTDQSVPSTTSITLIAVYGDSGARGNGYVYVVSTHSANSSAWTGSTTELSSITTGTQILFNLRVAPGGSNTTLNLTLANGSTTGAKSVYYSGTTRLGSQYPINSMIPLVYNGTAWYVASPYTNTQLYDRVQHSGAVTCSPGSTGLGIYVATYDGYKKLAATETFDINYAPLYMSASTTGITSTSAMYDVMPNVSLTNNKSGASLAAGKMIYIVGTLSGNTFTVDDAVFAVAPNTVDNKYYIPVGYSQNATTIYFQSSREVYKFDAYKGFGLLQNAAVVGTKTQYALSKSSDVMAEISSITYTYAVTTTDAEPSSIASTTVPATTSTNKYLWQKEVVAYVDTSITSSTIVNKLNEYSSGKTISTIAYTYIATATDTPPTESASGWASSVPSVSSPNTHIWQKEVITYSEQSVASVTTIKQIFVDWSETVPSVTNAGYLWSREKILYVIGDPEYSEPICISQYTTNIIQPDLENVKQYSYTQAAGLVQSNYEATLQAVAQEYVQIDDYTSYQSEVSSAISAKADSATITAINSTITTHTNQLGELETFKSTYGQRFNFTSNGLVITNAAGSAISTVLTNSAWQIKTGGTVVQQVDATDGAQFSSLTIKNLSGQQGKLVLGDLTIVVEDNGNIIGRKTG